MNGNWNGINSRYPEQIHQKVTNMYQDGTEPSMDVINTIIASYAASNCDERESRHQMGGLNDFNDMKGAIPRGGGGDHHHHHPGQGCERNEDGNRYTRFNDPGCRPDVKTSTPIKRQAEFKPDSPKHFVHPYAMNLHKESRDPEDALSNAATDQSGNRSDAGDSQIRETANELAHSISIVTKKLHWATSQLEENTSIDGSIHAVRLVSECAQTIAHLKKAKHTK